MKRGDFFSFFVAFIIGDTHGFLDDFKMQKQIIDAEKPEFILLECLENKKFLSQKAIRKQLEEKAFTETTQFKEIKNILAYALKKKIKLIGIDIKNFGLGNINIEKPTKQEEAYLKKLLPIRENHQTQMIHQYLKRTRRPVLVVTGAYHLRKNSPLLRGFKDKKIMLIYPSYKGKLLCQPVKNKEEVFYTIKCLNSKSQ